jgi:tRNA (mo5U34)-methyltransferase
MLLERFAPFFRRLAATPGAASWTDPLRRLTAERLGPEGHGDLPSWRDALAGLPDIVPAIVRLDAPGVEVRAAAPIGDQTLERLRRNLDALHPWRKGPFRLHGVTVDAEWRSDWKWARLADAVAPLAGRRLLDVGSGNGYYGYRALGAGADLVLGIDPTLHFVMQFLAVDAYARDDRLAVLPARDTDLPLDAAEGCFDTVFSMGVLYHRRNAGVHLDLLRRALRPGGQLVLETLILDDAPGEVLLPTGRYARMRNVHAVPGLDVLRGWLAEAGFRRIEVADVTRTKVAEQRSTDWMRFESLAQCLDAKHPQRTVEGHPAPTRAVLLAER